MSGSRLKWIAIITMLIDHIGAAIIEHYIRYTDWAVRGMEARELFYNLDLLLRSIGRMAFPIFIFLLVEGFFHTRSRLKYLLRLSVFCIISDIPFDLAVVLSNNSIRNGTFWTFSYQNVFFTLTLGFLGMMILEKLHEKIPNILVTVISFAAVAGGLYAAAEFLNTDYGGAGVAAILTAYAFKKYAVDTGRLPAQSEMIGTVIVLAALCNLNEAIAIVDTIFIRQYDGSRGKTISKWFFYIFYPAHLFILFLIRYWLF